MKKLLPILMVWLAITAKAITVTDTIFNRNEHPEYAFGADVSFVPMMESWGTKWLDKNGNQKDILKILKEQGINSIRLRVWTVNSGASSKQEVVNMCKRAKAMGLDVMIDFHYSDTWADPGSQTIPSAWTNHSVDALAKNIYDHTFDVLSAIKAAGVVPRWVQVGNETKRGMLYPVGQTNKGGSVAFARFVQNGYNAVKAVDSTTQVIVHLPDGHDNSLYRSIFDGLKKNGAKWDIIGLSAYPRWSHLDGPTMITRVMANINDLKSRYGTPCMVVETGHYPKEAVVGNQYLVGLMDRMIKNGDLGCFYWEPESMGGYDMGAWDEATRKPTVMMDAFLGVKHTEVPWMMRASMLSPAAEQTVEDAAVDLQVRVQHQRKGRLRMVEFYFDKTKTGTYKPDDPATVAATDTIPFTVANAAIGVHSAWARVTDNANNKQTTDTVTFYCGQSALADNTATENVDQRGGTQHWGLQFSEAGSYRLVFRYSAPSLCGAVLQIDGDSITRSYFLKKEDAFQTTDITVAQPGNHTLQMVASTQAGLPTISYLRIFPLEGQALPTSADLSGIDSQPTADADETAAVYSLSGTYLGTVPLSLLKGSLGDRPSAVVALPASGVWSGLPINSVGGTPYIVRKQRLK